MSRTNSEKNKMYGLALFNDHRTSIDEELNSENQCHSHWFSEQDNGLMPVAYCAGIGQEQVVIFVTDVCPNCAGLAPQLPGLFVRVPGFSVTEMAWHSDRHALGIPLGVPSQLKSADGLGTIV